MTKVSSASQRFAQSLLARAAELRVPSLFAEGRSRAVYQVNDRGGVSVVMLETGALSDEELTGILRFRLAEYLAAGFADPDVLHELGLDHEPRTSIDASDLHVVAGTGDGEILCYLAVRGRRPTSPGQTMGSHTRPLFPVEEMHGIGIYDRLRELPDLPVAKVRELGRFVKAQRLNPRDELSVRAPIEVVLALIRGSLGPLRSRIDAVVGEIEEEVVKRNLDFFEIPTVLVHGTVGYESPSWFDGHKGRAFYPFALSVKDVEEHSLPRVAAIEQALELRGHTAVRQFLALKRTAAPRRSRFEPPDGLPPLTNAVVPHADLPMPVRGAMRERGEWLRASAPFDRLTPAEATILHSLMTVHRRQPGDIIVREGEAADALFVIEQGEAEVYVQRSDGEAVTVGRLQAGDCFGEIALALGTRRSATVVARTPLTILRLSADDYARLLSSIDDVDGAFLRLAVERLTDTRRTLDL